MEGELQNHDFEEMVASFHSSQFHQKHYPGLKGFLSVTHRGYKYNVDALNS